MESLDGRQDRNVRIAMRIALIALCLALLPSRAEPQAPAWIEQLGYRPTDVIAIRSGPSQMPLVQVEMAGMDSAPGSLERRFGYVLERGTEPRADSIEFPGPTLVLTRGEPTSIEVVNRSGEPIAVHWHGIELDSYYDGVAGWSGIPGMPGRTSPAVKHGTSFEVRLTPKRAGTFMYHTHFDEMLNGSLTPPIMELEAGKTYRLRIADIAVFRQALRVRLLRDSALTSWRPIAKDGITLPPEQATMRPSIVNLPSGEMADFDFTPGGAGTFVLEVGSPNPNLPPEGSVVFHMSPAVR